MTHLILPLQKRAFLSQREGRDSKLRAVLPFTSMSGLCGIVQGVTGVSSTVAPLALAVS